MAMQWLIFCNSDGKVPEEVANELPNRSQVIPDKKSRTHCDRLNEAGSKSTHYSAPQQEDSIFVEQGMEAMEVAWNDYPVSVSPLPPSYH